MQQSCKNSEGDCPQAKCVSMYADGELAPDHAMDVEQHLERCAACTERLEFLRATRSSLRRSCRATPSSHHFRARIAATVCQMSRSSQMLDSTEGVVVNRDIGRDSNARSGLSFARDAARSGAMRGEHGEGSHPARLISARYAVAVAAAAGIVFAMGAWNNAESKTASRDDDEPSTLATSGVAVRSFDRMLDELVSMHAHPLPPETTNPDELQRFDPLVGVPVRRPAFRPFGASFDGARVHAVHDRRAAILQYKLQDGKRITMYVFDPHVFPVRQTRLEQQMVQKRPVYVGHLRGYSVAATEQRGVGYAVAADPDSTRSAEYVVAAMQP